MIIDRRTALALATACLSPAVWAQQDAFPSKRLTLVVPFATGNGIDQLSREYAEVLRTQVSQPVVVENREGAGGIIGSAFAARSEPDGHTMLVAAHPPFAISPLLQKTAVFDPLGSFVPVAKVGAVPLVAVTAASSPFRTWQEMAAHFKTHPDRANYAVSGIGSPGQLFTQLIKLGTGLPMQEISYKSTAQAMTDTLAGQVQLSLVSVPAAAAHIKSGTLRPLAIGSTRRLPGMPEVPTLAELLGQSQFEASVWYGFLVPAGTPQERVNRLYAEIARASQSQRVVDLMARASITPDLQNPQQFAATIRQDVALARKMIEAAKLAPQ